MKRFLPQSSLLSPHSYQGDAVNTTLTVDDPLAGQDVTIVITLPADDAPRDERPALVSLGMAGQLPVSKSGLFGDAAAIINEAWAAFGLRWQMAAAESAQMAIDEDETGADESETIAEAAVVQATSLPAPAASRPQNLSLF